jgi:hypothetical protein
MKEFDLLLSEAADGTINRIFGHSVAAIILEAAERLLSIKSEEVGQNFRVFFSYLERLLGQQQAMIIQSATLRYLCLRLRQEYCEIDSYFSLLDKLYETKFKLAASSRKEERPV